MIRNGSSGAGPGGPGRNLGRAEGHEVVARTEPGGTRHLVQGVDILGRRRPLQAQHPVHLVGHRVPEQQRPVPLVQVIFCRCAPDVLVVVLVPDHGVVEARPPIAASRRRHPALRSHDGQHPDSKHPDNALAHPVCR
jgi:hypothetical protein